ncbi:hypothetical protein NDU88_003795 [Pleurodeles waltl]|uniref:Uncharacterized protein n=1 Tax=Pleurodeles waltl TaxID=8319 RepID=A0AAV7WWA9_PLEWA|nr:hypothetical protein NDU88_003795 [Pleurodeles waltl]
MESEAKVLEAFALLRQAGRLDLLKEGALAPTRPACRASAGVGAAVDTSSPPCVAASGKVRGASRGAGAKGGPGAGIGRVYRRERVGESPRVSREPGRAGRRPSCIPARKWRAGPCVAAGQQALVEGQVRALEPSAGKRGKGKASGVRQERLGGSSQSKLKPSAAGATAASVALSGTVALPSGGSGKGGHSGGVDIGSWDLGSSPGGGGQSGIPQKQEAEGDPKIPLSIKWPTMLQWSSDEEGGDLGGAMCMVGGGSTSVSSGGAPGMSLGDGIPEGEVGGVDDGLHEEGLEGEEGFGVGGKWDISSSPGTPDLSWQGPLDYGDEDPGEQDAA